MKRSFIFITIIMLSVYWLSAQSSDKAFDQVVIKDNRLSTKLGQESRFVDVLSKDEIKRMPVNNIGALLQYIGGIDIRQRGPNGVQSDLSLRGGSFEQVLILINGIKVIDPQTGHHVMNLPIDLEVIERIEVIKGPAARIYGQNAFAGAINIVTKVPTKEYLGMNLLTGTHKLRGGKGSIVRHKKNRKSYFSASLERSEGYRDYTDYERVNFFIQNEFKWKKNHVTLMGSYVNNGFGGSNFYAGPYDSLSYETVRTALAAAIYKRPIKSGLIKAQVYHRWNHDNYIFNRLNPSLYENNHFSNVTGAEFNVNKSVTNFLILGAGIEGRIESLKSNNLGNHDRKIGSAYLETRFHFLKNKIHVTPGVSYHYYTDFGPKFFYGVDANVAITKKISAFGGVGTTYRVPSYTELYYSDRSNVGNANLKPEQALTYEVGLKYTGKYILFQGSYFKRDGRDIIDWTKVPIQVDTNIVEKWKPSNISKLPMEGIDASLVLKVNKFSFLSPLRTVRLSYTMLDGSLINPTNKVSKYTLEHINQQVNLSTQWGILSFLHFNMGVRYIDRITTDNYTVMDLGFGGKFLGIYVNAQLNNVLNTAYEEYPAITMPGRWWRVEVGYKF